MRRRCSVSVLFNEPKLLKWRAARRGGGAGESVSVLFNEPKLLKFRLWADGGRGYGVSVLFNEPKLLKSRRPDRAALSAEPCFSALQRAEIAEMLL